MARAQTMWKEWRQDLMWHPSVAPLRLHALHLIMRPRRTASSTFSRPPDSLTHTCMVRRLVSHQHFVWAQEDSEMPLSQHCQPKAIALSSAMVPSDRSDNGQ